ncbi:hypothetical protein JI666_04770 [Bacillus sp. NTK071]|nr:hypothetical protein [Bacillus sp. NTK071]MBN8208051.1 hypothetical protein [Bacillus sp. NTK071]
MMSMVFDKGKGVLLLKPGKDQEKWLIRICVVIAIIMLAALVRRLL